MSDKEEFLSAMRGVKRLKKDPKYAYKRKVKPKPINLIKDNIEIIKESLSPNDSSGQLSEGVTFTRKKIKMLLLKRLTQGQLNVETSIDLHGLTQIKARNFLKETIKACKQKGMLCVRVIHGKGIRSGMHGPVLKELTYQILSEMDEVLAFSTAKDFDGGSGAIYVLLNSDTIDRQ